MARDTFIHTARDLFRIIYKYARNEVTVRSAKTAYEAAERATDAYFFNFDMEYADLDAILAAQTAVLWAVHWRFFRPEAPVSRLWHCERRLAFCLGTTSYSWFVPPRASLPA